MRTDELIDYQRCPVCKDTLAECKCPECQCCGETGNPQCGINRIATLEARVRELEERVKELEKYQCRHPNTITNGTDYRCSSCQKEMTREEWLELVGEG